MEKIFSMETKQSYIRRLGMESLFPDSLLEKVELHLYETGEFVNRAGEPAQYFCICASGKMKVLPSSEEGKIVLLDYIKPAGFLGDIELLCHCDNLHSVRALTPCAVLAIPQPLFEKEMMEHVPFLKFVSTSLAEKLYSSSINYSRSMLYPVKSRFCHYLLLLSDEMESDRFPVKMIEAAQYLGITDRHLRRILTELTREGLLSQHGSTVIILDRKRLEQAASYL